MRVLPYLSQLFLGLLAFCALLKDWNDYGKLSRKWGKAVPLGLALVTILVTFLGLYETHRARVEQASTEASSQATISGLSGQIQQLRNDNKQNADGFRDSFTALYKQYSTLQSKTQNAELLKEIEATKQKLVDAQNSLTPPTVTPLATFPTVEAAKIPITETVLSRSRDFVTVDFAVYNPSNFNAKAGSVLLRVCSDCKYADEPTGFVRVVGGSESDRQHDFAYIYAKTALGRMTVHISVPPQYRSFQVGVFIGCENCSPAQQQQLKVIVQ
jgi:hypothetical protein